MQLHVLAGCSELLRPTYLSPEAAAGLVGPRVRIPRAFWISPRCGDRYHEFLQGHPGDRRTQVMAAAMNDDFGTRFEPLLILPGLLDELGDQRPHAHLDQRSQLTVLTEILECGHVQRLQLHALALPSSTDPEEFWAIQDNLVPDSVRSKVESLHAALASDAAPCEIETHVIEATAELPGFDTAYNNSLSAYFVRRLESRFLEYGWESNTALLSYSISTILSDWSAKGLSFITPLRSAHLDAIADLLFGQLLRK